ncbi:hypothetical protein [Lysinibacillus sp. BF-4]|uniref:hypothetical protein n=1 Tax=Lysinibacillus sp. BF-4 TaxID=1473546 RepID=UPI001F3E76FC|nr:hypothetical protein [Lysinibacillus sp. BF-4]
MSVADACFAREAAGEEFVRKFACTVVTNLYKSLRRYADGNRATFLFGNPMTHGVFGEWLTGYIPNIDETTYTLIIIAKIDVNVNQAMRKLTRRSGDKAHLMQ